MRSLRQITTGRRWDNVWWPGGGGRWGLVLSGVLGQIAFSFDNKHYLQDILQLSRVHTDPWSSKWRLGIVVTLMTLRCDDYCCTTLVKSSEAWENNCGVSRNCQHHNHPKDGNSRMMRLLNRRKLLWNLSAKKTTQHSMKIKLCFSWELLRGLN